MEKKAVRPVDIGDVVAIGRYVWTNGIAKRAGTYRDCTTSWLSRWIHTSVVPDEVNQERRSEEEVDRMIVGVLLTYCRIWPDILQRFTYILI